jgi:hypothetical protein
VDDVKRAMACLEAGIPVVDVFPERAAEQLAHSGDQSIEVYHPGLQRLLARAGEQTLGQARAPDRAFQSMVDGLLDLGRPTDPAARQLQVAYHYCQHVVEVMSDAATRTYDRELELKGPGAPSEGPFTFRLSNNEGGHLHFRASLEAAAPSASKEAIIWTVSWDGAALQRNKPRWSA